MWMLSIILYSLTMKIGNHQSTISLTIILSGEGLEFESINYPELTLLVSNINLKILCSFNKLYIEWAMIIKAENIKLFTKILHFEAILDKILLLKLTLLFDWINFLTFCLLFDVLVIEVKLFDSLKIWRYASSSFADILKATDIRFRHFWVVQTRRWHNFMPIRSVLNVTLKIILISAYRYIISFYWLVFNKTGYFT